MERISKEVWFVLTEAELIDRAKMLAQTRNEQLTIEWEMKEHAKAEKKKIEKKESEIADLCNQIRTGKECRILACDMRKDYESKTVKFFFEGILVDERPMTAEERQLTFDVIQGGQSNNLN